MAEFPDYNHTRLSGSGHVDDHGHVKLGNPDEEGRIIGEVKLRSDGRNTKWTGRIFGTYISAEGSSKDVVASMLIAGYIAAIQNEPGELLPF